MNNYLILRSQNSPYNDVTKSSVLSFADMDDNLIFLKGHAIYTATTNNGLVTLKKYNGEDITFIGGGGTGSDTHWSSGSTGSYSIKAVNYSTTDATGNYSLAEGYGTLASGDYSHAEGSNTVASGLTAHAEGNTTQANGLSSHAEGSYSQANGDWSHAEGYESKANGDYSHAEGETTIASGNASHAEGVNTIAQGNASHAEGSGTIASGDAAHTEGDSTIASGNYSHAGGTASGGYIVASGQSSFVHQYNSGNGQFGPGNYGTYGWYSAILGGQDHYISDGSESGAIMGGNGHLLYGVSLNSGIFGGNANLLIDTYNGVVLGGDANGTIQADGSAIVGGYNNLIDAYYYSTEPYAFIGGGYNNKIITGGGTTGEASAIIGGNGNTINGNNEYVGIYNSFGSTATSQNVSAIISSYESTIEDMIGAGSSYNNVIIGAYNSRIEANGMSYVSIFGGANNNIYQDNSFAGVVPNYSVIIGGDTNRIDDSDTATILNGFTNTINTNSKQSSILNGQFHSIASSKFSAIIGGNSNEMTDSDGSALIGGSDNSILSDGNPAFTRYYNAILGGTGNTINNGELCFIMGGYQNVIPYGTVGSVILGGDSITANSNNTVFVQRLNIKYAQNDNTTTKLLTIDNNGLIKYRNVSSISGGTGGGSGTTIDLYWASGTTGTYSIKANNGSTTDATSNYAFANGFNTLASGLYSNSEGNDTESRGESSHAQNHGTLAKGNYSHAGGYNTTASGITSFVHSTESTAFGDRTVVLGGSNIAGNNSDTVYVPYLNIQSATTDNTLTSFLVRNGDGSIKTRTLPQDIYVTGGTYSNGTATFRNVSGGTFNVTGFKSNDIFVTGGTYNNSIGTTTFTNNTGGTFNVTGYYTGATITPSVTGFTYSNNNLTIKQSNGDLNVVVNTMTGLTVNGNLTFTGQSNNPVYTAGTVTATHTPNWDNSNIQHVILSAATTTIANGTNIKNGAVYTMILKQNATGSRVVTWGSQYKWQSGIAPILTSTSNAVDILTFISDGTNLYGLIAKDFR